LTTIDHKTLDCWPKISCSLWVRGKAINCFQGSLSLFRTEDPRVVGSSSTVENQPELRNIQPRIKPITAESTRVAAANQPE